MIVLWGYCPFFRPIALITNGMGQFLLVFHAFFEDKLFFLLGLAKLEF